MLNREIGLPGKIPQHGAPHPTASKAGVQSNRTVDQPNGDINVLAEKPEHERGAGKDIRIIRSDLECPPSETNALATAGLSVVRPAVCVEQVMTVGCQGEGWTIMRITANGLAEQVERLNNTLFFERAPEWESA